MFKMFMLEHLLSNKLIPKVSYSRCTTLRRLYSNTNKLNHPETEAEIPSTENIRNFSIIAHVDHGKSTLADRLLEYTGAIKPGQHAQVLDQLQVERERGITVKAVTASLNHTHEDRSYLLNLIDTPGHVDFSNEVVRSVQVCQGAILLVDAADGPQAQTVAVHSLARRKGLTLIPVLNKIDLPRANPEKAKHQLNVLFKIDPKDVLEVSAKKGWGIDELMAAIVERIPPPTATRDGFLKAVVFDTWHNRHKGVLCLAYIESGVISVNSSVKWHSSNKQNTVKYLYILTPQEKPIQMAGAGQVVVFGCGPKGGGSVGDILLSTNATLTEIKAIETRPIQHMVYAGIFPSNQSEFQSVQSAVQKLSMNDSAADVRMDTSPALGQGWRVGFLGLLHMEVFTQRLLQEYKAEAIISAPSVPYKVKLCNPKLIKKHKTDVIMITNPNDLPDKHSVEEYYEPFVIANIMTPLEYLGKITALCVERRGISISSTSIDENHIMLEYRLPLCEVIINFHDILKSITSGYANFDYHDDGFHPSHLIKLDILLNSEPVEELSSIVHVSRAYSIARQLVDKLKDTIPRQMVQIAIQASTQGKIIARETLKAYRKDVTAKLYGGDVTRRMKLLRNQAEGKKQMRSVANIRVDRQVLIDVLKK